MKYLRRFLIISAVLLAVFTATTSMAEVYINYFPEDVTVNEGGPIEVPIFFNGNSLTGRPIDLFVWKEAIDTPDKEYLGPSGWIPFNDPASIQPVFSLEAMIEYANIMWTVFDSTAGMDSFTLYICIKDIENGNSSCGQRQIHITPPVEPPPPAPPVNCSGLSLSPNSISETLTRGVSKTLQISVKNSCGQGIDFNAATAQSWISLTKQTGLLTVTLNSSSLSPSTYKGTINITAGGSSATANVDLTVKSPTFNFGSSSCTSSTISAIWPVYISTTAGGTESTGVSVANNCGTPLSYGASVVSESPWLSVSQSGTGTLTVTVSKTSTLQSGNYTGKVQVTASGYSPIYFNVNLEITGPCAPKSAVVSPTSITQSVTQGSNGNTATVSVKDNCGSPLPYTVDPVTYPTGAPSGWVTVSPTQGSGTFQASFTTNSFQQGSYSATIKVTSPTYPQQVLSIPVTINVGTVDTSVTELQNRSINYFNIAGSGVKYFKYYSNVPNPKGGPLQIGLADMSQDTPSNADMIIKYGSIPTMDDYNSAKQGNAVDNLYYALSSTSFEFVEIYGVPDNPAGWYYIMVVNTKSTPESDLRITIGDVDGI